MSDFLANYSRPLTLQLGPLHQDLESPKDAILLQINCRSVKGDPFFDFHVQSSVKVSALITLP